MENDETKLMPGGIHYIDTEIEVFPKLVLIEWEDSAQPVSGWSWLDGHTWESIIKCRSVGWLIHDGEDVKALAPNMGDMGGEESAQVPGVIRIPARAIIKITELSTEVAQVEVMT